MTTSITQLPRRFVAPMWYFMKRTLVLIRRPRVMRRAYRNWISERGDESLRINYPLHSDSIIFDVGGFEGAWSAEMSERYAATIHVFEPVPTYADRLNQRFTNKTKIHVHSFGLGHGTRTEKITISGDASSLHSHKRGNPTLSVQIADIADTIDRICPGDLDLIKINIEGAEFELLPRLIQSGRISKVNALQIQFHHFVKGAKKKRAAIRAELSKTHQCIWNYPFIWESWQRKPATISTEPPT